METMQVKIIMALVGVVVLDTKNMETGGTTAVGISIRADVSYQQPTAILIIDAHIVGCEIMDSMSAENVLIRKERLV